MVLELVQLPMLAGEEEDLAGLGQLRQQGQDGGQAVVVEGEQGVVQDQGAGLGIGEDQLGYGQAQGQIELVGGALAEQGQGVVG